MRKRMRGASRGRREEVEAAARTRAEVPRVLRRQTLSRQAEAAPRPTNPKEEPRRSLPLRSRPPASVSVVAPFQSEGC